LELAAGGQATVYLARADNRSGIQRFVALKRLHPHLANDADFREMFLDEARIASLVQHANVCNLLDFDVSEAGCFLVMEYLAGESLAQVFRAMARRRTSTPVERPALIARVIADACEGLHAAHEVCDASGEPLDVVHRDISPDNVFVTYDGVVKVCDFGVARASHQQHKTRTGVLKGKYAYMAPEVLRGQTPDRRADIWSIGVVLWELLTQKRLFSRSSDLETLKTLSNLRIPAPSRTCSGLPRYLDAIVLRALSRDPAARPASARELGQELSRALVERRQAVGLAELSEWMEALFPGGRACRRQLLQIAAGLEGAARDSIACDARRLAVEASEVDAGAPTALYQCVRTGSTLQSAKAEEIESALVDAAGDGEPTIVRVAEGEPTIVRMVRVPPAPKPRPTSTHGLIDVRYVELPKAACSEETPLSSLPAPEDYAPARTRPIRRAAIATVAVLGAAALGAAIWRQPAPATAAAMPAAIEAAPSPATPAPPPPPAVPVKSSATAPYSVELEPRAGSASTDIVIRISPVSVSSAPSKHRSVRDAALPRSTAPRRSAGASAAPAVLDAVPFQAAGMP
jgi:serine/threonine-protein kinase